MRETFRQSMAYLHTWLGLALGFLLMVIFFFGSLSVFDREIDRWSIPETRAPAAPLPSFDKVVLPIVPSVKPDADDMARAAAEVIGPLPPVETLRATGIWVGSNHRDPLVRMFLEFDIPNKPVDPNQDHGHVHGNTAIDPATGQRLTGGLEDRLAIGTRFFFPMHFMLHVEWAMLGYWIVGLAGMTMLAALVSGVVMHRRIFREFFTFRPEKNRLRSTLDLHNMTGVLALPFLFVITFSGLLIFADFYVPSVTKLMRPLEKSQETAEAGRTGLPEDPAGQPGQLASVDKMMSDAKARWAERGVPGEVGFVSVTHFGDVNAYVTVGRDNVDRVATQEEIHFNGMTGELMYENPPTRPIEAVKGFLYGLHFQHFKHWGLRWLLFVGGLIGCACIATGFLFFVEKRKRKHAAAGSIGSSVVDALAVTSVTGMLVATATMMLANRVLPVDLPAHDTWQKSIFWFTWLATLVHAGLRSKPVASGGASSAWAEQCWAVAALATMAVLANWVTTGDHLLKTLSDGYWPVAGVDIVMLIAAAAAGGTAYVLSRRSQFFTAAAREMSAPAVGSQNV